MLRADAIVFRIRRCPRATRGCARPPQAAFFRAVRGRVAAPVAVARPRSLAPARAGVGLLFAIARPERLRRSLEALGARVVAERIFPDHHFYAARDLAGLAAQAPLWITTEKDAVKLLPDWCGVELRVLGEELEVEEPEALLDWLERTLNQRRQRARDARRALAAGCVAAQRAARGARE